MRSRPVHSEYIIILLYGFANHWQHLSEYFWGEFKKAQNQSVEYNEFFSRLIDANTSLYKLIDEQYRERRGEVSLMRSLRKEKGLDLEGLELPERSDFPVQGHQIHKISNGKCQGQLWLRDLEYISSRIKHAMRKDLGAMTEFYNEVKWCIPFRTLHHQITTVCQFLKPIQPLADSLSYIDYFFQKIDFEKIDSSEDIFRPTKNEILEYCDAIYYGLEQILKRDIDEWISKYQMSIAQLGKDQMNETQKQIIEIIGNLKRQTRNMVSGPSFSKQYLHFREQIRTKKVVISVDYQMLIFSFSETMALDILSSYEIINETFNQTYRLLDQTLNTPAVRKSRAVLPSTFEEIFHHQELVQPCIDVLKKLSKPAINQENQFIGRSKAVFCVWIDQMKHSSPAFIKIFPDKVYAELLNKHFIGLDMTKDGSLFRKANPRADSFSIEIKDLLSHISHLGK